MGDLHPTPQQQQARDGTPVACLSLTKESKRHSVFGGVAGASPNEGIQVRSHDQCQRILCVPVPGRDQKDIPGLLDFNHVAQ